jgi:hypothetical protein
MSDLEKKRSLLQVLTRIREQYRRVYAVCEWTKLRNEHLTVKVLAWQLLKTLSKHILGALGRLSEGYAAVGPSVSVSAGPVRLFPSTFPDGSCCD